MKLYKKVIMLCTSCFLLTGCFESNSLENASISTTVYPVEYLTKYLYQDNGDVVSIYPAGVDIDTYKMSKKQIKEYAKSDLFIYNGLTSEKEIAKELLNKNKNMLIIDVSYGLKYNYGIEELWLSPNNFLMLAKNIKEYLNEYIDSKYLNEEINANYKKLEEVMSTMDAELRGIAADAKKDGKNCVIVSSSDVFKYLENYGFTVVSLEDETNLSENSLNAIKSNFKNSKYSSILMFENEEQSDLIKSLVESYKANVVTVDSMYALDEDDKYNNETYLSLMDEYIDNIRRIVK